MSAPAQEHVSAPVQVDCPSCEIDFDLTPDPGEARYLAGVHNDLHHGGGPVAAVVDVDADTDAAQLVPVAGAGWLASVSVYADAQAQAVPYAGDESASDRAWSARVDAAVAGMDVLDPAGVDEWMNEHAESEVPHQVEAGLVAAWETHIRALYDSAEPDGLTDQHHDTNADTHDSGASAELGEAAVVEDVEEFDEYAL
jgi:hypothetical protein